MTWRSDDVSARCRDLVREGEEADELGRDEVGDGHPVALDQVQRALGVEAVHDDDGVPEVERRNRHDERRGVIPGAGEQMDVVGGVGVDVVAGHQCRAEVGLLGCSAGEARRTPLGGRCAEV